MLKYSKYWDFNLLREYSYTYFEDMFLVNHWELGPHISVVGPQGMK